MFARISLFLLLMTAACPRPGNDFSAADTSIAASAYPKVFRLWTKSIEFYHNPSRVFVDAVYFSWQMREAKVALLAKNYALSQKEADELREAERQSYNQYHEFFIKFYTDPKKVNDLNLKTTQWRVSLSDNRGNEVVALPSDFVKVSDGVRNLTDKERQLYEPILDDFSFYYRVRFPRVLPDGTPLEPTGPGGRLTLRFSSPLTKIDLNWIAKP
jgi:hypothetical protein